MFPVTYDRAIDEYVIQYVWCYKKVMKINFCLFDFGESRIKSAIGIESIYTVLIN